MQALEKKPEVLISGKTSFKLEVPYKLVETGRKNGKKPLILYLHGFGDHLKSFEARCDSLLTLNAFHLFIQGPYPLYSRSRSKPVSEWGRAWYLYDGNKQQFIKTLEISAEFLQEVVDNLIKLIDVSRICIFGYSMGGYLAGYFALTRWKHITDLIVINARIKTEIVNQSAWTNLKHLNVLALHGIRDDKVNVEPQQKAVDHLQKNGISSKIELLDTGHGLDDIYFKKSKDWLIEKGYKS